MILRMGDIPNTQHRERQFVYGKREAKLGREKASGDQSHVPTLIVLCIDVVDCLEFGMGWSWATSEHLLGIRGGTRDT